MSKTCESCLDMNACIKEESQCTTDRKYWIPSYQTLYEQNKPMREALEKSKTILKNYDESYKNDCWDIVYNTLKELE